MSAEVQVTVDFQKRLDQFGSKRFTTLREGQALVLSAYAESYLQARDLAIEMPTGDGKTLVALLLADYALDQGRSVAYLTGTRQLAEHVSAEAEALGLEAVRFLAKRYGGRALDDYHQAQAVGVMNYWVYFNSKPVPQPADLVIFDDAHLAEQPLTGMHTLRIPRAPGAATDLYETVCDLVLSHTDAYTSLQAMRDGTALPGSPPELLAFNDWAAVVGPAEDLIHASPFVSDGDAKYAWRQVRERLSRCGVLIGSSAIEIRPYHPPTALNSWYSRARQRVYLSATLGSMDDLQRRIGGMPVERLDTSKPLPAASTGQRRLVLNPTAMQAFDDPVFAFALRQVAAAGGRGAWLCSSHAEADRLEHLLAEAGDPVYRLRAGDDDMVDTWKGARRGHLVTAGRYDGLDLEGDICKLVIVPTVPQASSEFERFVVAYLGDASFMRHRVGQRITQAIGRANRAPTDRALYLGLDPTFAQILADPAVRRSIASDAESTVQDALVLHELGWDRTLSVCEDFWTHADEQVVARPGKRRPGRSTTGIAHVRSAESEVTAATDLWLGGYADAARAANLAADDLAHAGETEHAAFWRYVEAHAYYERGRPEDFAAARAALDEAIKNGPRTTWFRRLARTADELAGKAVRGTGLDDLFLVWDEWIREAGARIDRHLADARAGLTGTHDEQCESLVTLARLAGARGGRPSSAEQSATDCRWSWVTPRRGERRVWEVKTGGFERIPRKDVNQLLGQIEVERKRAAKARVLGCLVSPVPEVKDDAAEAAREKVALLHRDAVVRLFDLLGDRFRDYIARCEDGRAEARGNARSVVEPLLPSSGWLETLLGPSAGRVLTIDDVTDVFPRR